MYANLVALKTELLGLDIIKFKGYALIEKCKMAYSHKILPACKKSSNFFQALLGSLRKL